MKRAVVLLLYGVVSCLAVPAIAQQPSQTSALDRANLDTTCAACSDFYRFANGGWLKRTTIPAAYSSFNAFQELADRNEAVLHDILNEDAAAVKGGSVARGSAAWKVGAFYATCMDSSTIDARGATPLRPELDVIAAIRTRQNLTNALAVLERRASIAPFNEGPAQDSKDAANTIAGLYQGGLSLPNSEYYTKTDSASSALRDSFRLHVARMFVLLGDAPDRAASEAKAVLEMESRLARASHTPVELRDPLANYHRMSLAQVDSLTPHFSWKTFYASLGAPIPKRIDIGQPAFFRALDSLLVSAPLNDWKALLRWRAAHAASPSLSTPFVQENFTFEKLFSGAKEILPRWKRCVASTDARLGELLGQEYVKRTFPPSAKVRAAKIVDDLVKEFRVRIAAAAWMSPPTKRQAIIKLDAFTRKIGYPDRWLDYSKLAIVTSDYFTNVRAADQWSLRRQWAKINRPTNRTEWGMTPPTVNAYTNPLLNEIVFPAGILQPPFFDAKADDAVNYGAMGGAIGHEISHEFDDQGRQYDEVGNLRDWWAKEDEARYVMETDKIVKQFDAYTVLDTATHVNGKLTLGENIGDFGGLTIAYAAMERALGRGPRTKIDGFTPEQRFFLGWAQVWRALDRPEYQRMLVRSNPHSPPEWRVNGPLSNMPEFRAAWGCNEGDPMVRAEAVRPRIW
ncbi:MAG: M13 family metallopeptidase [Gemmatimonadaceae bacterium]